MKKTKLFASILSAVLLTAISAYAVFAETYHISDNLRFLLDEGNAYLAGIEDNRTTLDVPAMMGDYPVTATTMDFASYNTDLVSVTFENAENISIIGSYGFYNCTNLRNVNLGTYVDELYRGVFRGCTSLESVQLSDSITEIPYECFYGCSSLGEITLGRNITMIQENSFRGCTNLVIRCYYDSYAHTFAMSHNIPYELIDGALLGDTTGDGLVNINDVTAIQRHVAELELLEGINLHAGDVNQSDVTDITDASALQGYLAEYETGYPIGEAVTQ